MYRLVGYGEYITWHGKPLIAPYPNPRPVAGTLAEAAERIRQQAQLGYSWEPRPRVAEVRGHGREYIVFRDVILRT